MTVRGSRRETARHLVEICQDVKVIRRGIERIERTEELLRLWLPRIGWALAWLALVAINTGFIPASNTAKEAAAIARKLLR